MNEKCTGTESGTATVTNLGNIASGTDGKRKVGEAPANQQGVRRHRLLKSVEPLHNLLQPLEPSQIRVGLV